MVAITALNGRVPDALLVEVDDRGHRLLAIPAEAFGALSAAMAAAGMGALRLSPGRSAYRTLDDQKYMLKIGQTTIPAGESQHGEGVAGDLADLGGFGGGRHQWLVAHGPTYGWRQPAWALQGGSLPEPWHWEHDGATRAPEPKPAKTSAPTLDPFMEDDMLERTLIAAYRLECGRTPASSELDPRLVRIALGQSNIAAEIRDIDNSLESKRWSVIAIYREFLGRDATVADADQWLAATAGDVAKIRAGVAGSDEAKAYAAKKA